MLRINIIEPAILVNPAIRFLCVVQVSARGPNPFHPVRRSGSRAAPYIERRSFVCEHSSLRSPVASAASAVNFLLRSCLSVASHCCALHYVTQTFVPSGDVVEKEARATNVAEHKRKNEDLE